jgi:hypothetical protein
VMMQSVFASLFVTLENLCGSDVDCRETIGQSPSKHRRSLFFAGVGDGALRKTSGTRTTFPLVLRASNSS